MSESAIDVGVQQVARVYAEGLLRAAEKRGKGDAVLDELDTLVHELFRAQPLLEGFLSSGAIRRDQSRVFTSVSDWPTSACRRETASPTVAGAARCAGTIECVHCTCHAK